MHEIEPAVLLQHPGGRAISDDPNEIRLFSKCRNERLRLPAFLRHYRNIGVQRFFFADNASSDGTVELLVQQPDVHVFGTDSSFRSARGGTAWLNALLKRFGVGRWCVTVDVDELFYYPGIEAVGLAQLTSYLDRQQREAMCCLLLDLYPDGPIREAKYQFGDDLVSAAPFFDAAPYERVPHTECPPVLIYGGVRERVFYPESRAGDWRRELHVTLFHRLLLKLPAVRKSAWILAHRPLFPPCLTKVPLVRWDERSQYLNVNHFVSPKKLAEETGVLLHFKLLQDFHARASQEVTRGEYYDGAIEFRRYLEKLRVDPQLNFRHEGSVRLEDSAQLAELGLIRDTPTWEQARDRVADRDANP